MRLLSAGLPEYLPEKEQTTVARLGLHSLAAREWMKPDGDFALFQQHKLEQAELRPDSVFGQLPGSESAVAEFIDSLRTHLLDDHSDQYEQRSDRLHHLPSNLTWPLYTDSLWDASLWIQEDICVLQEIDNEYQLTAASVCSPSNWHPAEKLGKNLSTIHKPVPDYADKLEGRVDSLFASMSPRKPLLRYNWSLQYGNELYWRDKLAPRDPTAKQYWRLERQTLRRLPITNAIVFSIKISLHERGVIEQDLLVKENLQQLLRTLPEQEKLYKGLD